MYASGYGLDSVIELLVAAGAILQHRTRKQLTNHSQKVRKKGARSVGGSVDITAPSE